ncbi:S41 family peptidase [bacterium]|nr:S41 family peptidase [bacterium]
MPRASSKASNSAVSTPLNGALIAWLVGFLAVMATTLLGWFSLLRLQYQARECFDESLVSDLESVRKDLGIRRPIRLLISSRRDIPMTWGIFRPILHLPVKARQWNTQERRAVLIHELAHVRRFDSAIQLLAQIVSALYWYNPLVWLANRMLRAEQESSCDDTVIRSGTSAPVYAKHLTCVVSGRSVFPWESAVALAAGRKGKLEARIQDILATHQNRQTPSPSLAGLTVAVTIGAALTIGVLSPFTSSLQAATQSAPDRAIPADDFNDLNILQETIIKQSFKNVDSDKLTRATIEGMLESLDDPHARYLSAVELASMQFQLSGEMFGIGAQLRMIEDRLVVVRPIPGSPALAAGIQASDVITEVDGKAAQGQSLLEIVNQIRGPLGTKIQLGLERDGQERSITVTRGRIKLPTVFGLRGVVTSEGVSEPDLIGKNSNIGYMQISQFGNQTAEELNDRISALDSKGMKGAIIDLRFCPGGSLEPATKAADLFLEEGQIVRIQDRDGEQRIIRATQDIHWQFPLVILVNEATASAAEILCGALQDHERVIILGTRTFGKGSVQSLLHINQKLGAIRLTTAQYFLPKGKNIDRSPTSSSWGIDATDGYFVPNESENLTLKNRLQGTRPIDQAPLSVGGLTVDGLSKNLNDPQLVAGLEAIESKVGSGAFKKMGRSRTELQKHIMQQELKRQQSTLLEKLIEIQSSVNNLANDDK